MAYKITDECIACGTCASECPVDAKCGNCANVCPVGAPKAE